MTVWYMLAVMKRTGITLLLVLGLVSLLLVWAIHVWLGTWIKTAVEQVGPRITKTTVQLNGVNISLLSGRIQLTGLVVGNPQGFRAPSALKLGNAILRVDWKTALSDTLTLEEIVIDGPEVTVEGQLSGSNISKIRDNVKAFASSGTAPKGRQPAGAQGQEGGKKILVKDFRLTNGRVTLWASAGPLGDRSLAVGLPDTHLRDIGKERGGLRPEELLFAVFTAIYDATARAVTGSGRALEKGAEAVRESSEKMGDAAKKASSKLLESFK